MNANAQGGDQAPQQKGKVEPDAGKLKAMNQSAAKNASPAEGGTVPCEEKKSWFAIQIVQEKGGAVIEGLTLKLKIPDLGDTDRVTSKATDPVKIEQLAPGGTGEVKQIECADDVWEAVGDIE